MDGTPYEQPCKTKNSTLLGFYWICNEIVFLTSLGIEIFNVIPEITTHCENGLHCAAKNIWDAKDATLLHP